MTPSSPPFSAWYAGAVYPTVALAALAVSMLLGSVFGVLWRRRHRGGFPLAPASQWVRQWCSPCGRYWKDQRHGDRTILRPADATRGRLRARSDAPGGVQQRRLDGLDRPPPNVAAFDRSHRPRTALDPSATTTTTSPPTTVLNPPPTITNPTTTTTTAVALPPVTDARSRGRQRPAAARAARPEQLRTTADRFCRSTFQCSRRTCSAIQANTLVSSTWPIDPDAPELLGAPLTPETLAQHPASRRVAAGPRRGSERLTGRHVPALRRRPGHRHGRRDATASSLVTTG